MRPARQRDLTGIGALVLVSQLGLVVALPIFLGVWGGKKIGEWLGAPGICTVAGLFLGLVMGIAGAINAIRKELPW